MYHISDFFDRFANVLRDLVVRKPQDGVVADRELIVAVTVIHEGKAVTVVRIAV
jgi:hypothetical protein